MCSSSVMNNFFLCELGLIMSLCTHHVLVYSNGVCCRILALLIMTVILYITCTTLVGFLLFFLHSYPFPVDDTIVNRCSTHMYLDQYFISSLNLYILHHSIYISCKVCYLAKMSKLEFMELYLFILLWFLVVSKHLKGRIKCKDIVLLSCSIFSSVFA